MRISACSSDVCSSDLRFLARELDAVEAKRDERDPACEAMREAIFTALGLYLEREGDSWHADLDVAEDAGMGAWLDAIGARRDLPRSEEHTSELQSLMRTSYAVFCLQKKKNTTKTQKSTHN